MKLPEADRVFIDDKKITEYCLSTEHDDGRHKAELFLKLLGLTAENADVLLDALRKAAATADAVPTKADKYGQRYLVDFAFTGRGRTAMIRSVWIVRTNEQIPRLVTCYIL